VQVSTAVLKHFQQAVETVRLLSRQHITVKGRRLVRPGMIEDMLAAGEDHHVDVVCIQVPDYCLDTLTCTSTVPRELSCPEGNGAKGDLTMLAFSQSRGSGKEATTLATICAQSMAEADRGSFNSTKTKLHT
jgi:hypothetical protein